MDHWKTVDTKPPEALRANKSLPADPDVKLDAPEPNLKQQTVLQLLVLGYSQRQVSSVCNLSMSTVKQIKTIFGAYVTETPVVRASVDRVQTLIPKAIDVYENLLYSEKETVALSAARDILITHRVLIERKELAHSDVDDLPTDRLVAEAERIIASEKGEVEPSAGDDQQTPA